MRAFARSWRVSSAPSPAFELAGTVADAADAILFAAEQQPDVAIVDVRMPGAAEQQPARGIKLRSPHTAVLAFSAHDDAAGRSGRWRRPGAAGYLVKGTAVTAIVASIRHAGSGSNAPDLRRAA